MELMTQKIILKNVRCLTTKVYNKRTVNMGLVMDVFGCEPTMAVKKCQELGIDPFSHKIELYCVDLTPTKQKDLK